MGMLMEEIKAVVSQKLIEIFGKTPTKGPFSAFLEYHSYKND